VTSGGATVAEYRYNGRGERVKKVTGSTVRFYQYDQTGLLLAETNSSGATLREYVYLEGLPVALINSTGIYYYHTDHLGTPQFLTDNNQTVAWQANYDPFGRATVVTQGVVNNLRLPGQYYDSETGLHYNYYRDYDPTLGRYIESDPIGLTGGINPYVYAGNHPLTYVDPLGLIPNPAEAACLGGPNPICLGGLVGDVASSLLGGSALAGILMMSGDSEQSADPTDAIADAPVPVFPGINDLDKECIPGKRLTFIILKGRHKGRVNVEQEYQCRCGLVTRHTIVTPNGKVVHDHFRPGPAKGNPDD
jgi:RHS repeat-associated protein